MKNFIAIIAAVFIAAPAFAIGLGNDNPASGGTSIATATQGQNQGQAQGQLQGQGQAQFTNVDVSNRISNDVRSNALSFAAGGQGGDARSNSASYSGGGAAVAGNSLTINQAPIPDKMEIKTVPNVYGATVYPTAPCMGSSAIGGSGVGFGFSIGSSWTDDECGVRETSRSFAGLGLKDDALKVLCSSKYAAAAPSCAKPEGEAK